MRSTSDESTILGKFRKCKKLIFGVGAFSLGILATSLARPVRAENLSLQWKPSTGDPDTYIVSYGWLSGAYNKDVELPAATHCDSEKCTASFSNVPPQYLTYIAARAKKAQGVPSPFSNELKIKYLLKPNPINSEAGISISDDRRHTVILPDAFGHIFSGPTMVAKMVQFDLPPGDGSIPMGVAPVSDGTVRRFSKIEVMVNNVKGWRVKITPFDKNGNIFSNTLYPPQLNYEPYKFDRLMGIWPRVSWYDAVNRRDATQPLTSSDPPLFVTKDPQTGSALQINAKYTPADAFIDPFTYNSRKIYKSAAGEVFIFDVEAPNSSTNVMSGFILQRKELPAVPDCVPQNYYYKIDGNFAIDYANTVTHAITTVTLDSSLNIINTQSVPNPLANVQLLSKASVEEATRKDSKVNLAKVIDASQDSHRPTLKDALRGKQQRFPRHFAKVKGHQIA